MVGVAGFEPATYWFQTSHANQTALHPEYIGCEALELHQLLLVYETSEILYLPPAKLLVLIVGIKPT